MKGRVGGEGGRVGGGEREGVVVTWVVVALRLVVVI